MRHRLLTGFFLAGWLLSIPAFAQNTGDPISGKWRGDWGPSRFDRNQVTVDLKLQGKTVTGNVNPGPNAVPIKNGTFDEKMNTVHMEADVKGPGDQTIHYVIDGKVDQNTLTGSWNHGARKGDFKITKE